MPEARFGRIVAEIRAQIAAGTLTPGDRAPSARQITQEWGVAIATATKVLKQLQAEGLVRAVTGVGTIVQSPPVVTAPRAPAPVANGPLPDGELGRARIVAAATAIADREGIAALSMRAVAAALGVATMSLYRHVPGKDELVLAMIDAAFAEAVPPTAPPKGWRVRLETLARLQWWLGRKHPWLVHVMSMVRPQLVPNAMAHTDWTMRALEDTALDLEQRIQVAVTLSAHVRSHALDLESERQALLDSGLSVDEWLSSQEAAFAAIVSERGLAQLARIADVPDLALDSDSMFEFGLERLLDGIAALIERPDKRSKRPRRRPTKAQRL
ncbi:MAG TPA: GntR family transcriptional regulator [Polyangia bacterium]|nr:GntR family transcriptional regulator [Polyangia bacterium]